MWKIAKLNESEIRDENPDADDSTTEPAPASSSALAPSAHTPAAAPKASASSSSSKLAAYAYAPPAATARPDATQPAVPEQYDIDTRFAPDSAIGMDVDGTTAPVASTSLAHGFTGSSGVAGVGLTVSTNPMFPGAIVKRTGHSSHAGEGAGGRARSSIGRNGTTVCLSLPFDTLMTSPYTAFFLFLPSSVSMGNPKTT